MLKLNPITGRKGLASELPITITEEQFWTYYLKILMVRNTTSLTYKEVGLLTYVLCGNPDRSYFRGKEAKKLKENFRMKKADLSKIKSSLVSKGFIEETGVVRGDALITSSLRKFQKYIKAAMSKGLLPPIVFNFSFEIKNDTKEQGKHIDTDSRRVKNVRGTSKVYNGSLLVSS